VLVLCYSAGLSRVKIAVDGIASLFRYPAAVVGLVVLKCRRRGGGGLPNILPHGSQDALLRLLDRVHQGSKLAVAAILGWVVTDGTVGVHDCIAALGKSSDGRA
jgi:hypothetical protein